MEAHQSVCCRAAAAQAAAAGAQREGFAEVAGVEAGVETLLQPIFGVISSFCCVVAFGGAVGPSAWITTASRRLRE